MIFYLEHYLLTNYELITVINTLQRAHITVHR